MTLCAARHSITSLLAGSALLAIFASAAAEELPLSSKRSDLTAEDLARVDQVTRPTTDFSDAEAYEAMQGGASTSIHPVDGKAFSHASANLKGDDLLDFQLGNALFRKFWVAAPSSTQASDGLGPLYNARSCQSCHLNDGRGQPPRADGDATSMFLRLARPAKTPDEHAAFANHRALNFPDPVYGTQLQDVAVPGIVAEGKVAVSYTEQAVRLAGGETVSLRKPHYSAASLNYGPLDTSTTTSARVTQPMLGLGLIEAIADSDILAHADPDDANGDGISGRLSVVRDHRSGEPAIGRFGWKAQNATVRDQSADALSGDIGISSPDRPAAYGDCTEAESACRKAPNGVQKRLGKSEAPPPVLDLITFYSENLAVPARRKASFPEVLKGKQVFYETGCPACHMPKFVTRRDAGRPAQSFQLIWPYSDFLLHDMGEGLADGQQVGSASGREWRTQPLWGIGLTETVSGHTFFLHDGRARNLTEAILWHGGEAQAARDAFAALAPDDRKSLLTFLESL